MTAADTTRTRTPLYRHARVLRVVAQLAAVAVAVVILWVLWFNLTNNLRAAGLSTDFEFLDQALAVNIAGSDLSPNAPIWRGLLEALKNTFALAVVGIPVLTVIGVLIGIARLSTNWLVSKLAGLYVELLRNLPPLLIIFFVFNAVFLELPLIGETTDVFGLLLINNRFLSVVGFTAQDGFALFWWMVAAGVVAAVGVWLWRTRSWEQTGEPHHRVAWSLGLVTLVAILAFIALDGPIGLSLPVLEGRALSGGFSGLTAYFAVLIALVLYTASHVAEITRGSILAVSRGQTEAANSLALSPFQRLRHVILPQAMRIAIPPIISQYLNFVKNTSLAIAVGYAEITRVTFQAIGNGQPAPQLILILMAMYLVISLIISALVNVLNRRLALASR